MGGVPICQHHPAYPLPLLSLSITPTRPINIEHFNGMLPPLPSDQSVSMGAAELCARWRGGFCLMADHAKIGRGSVRWRQVVRWDCGPGKVLSFFSTGVVHPPGDPK